MRQRSRLAVVAVALVLGTSSAHVALKATLLGSNETPPNASSASCTAAVTLGSDNKTVLVVSGLNGPASGAHIHCCAPPGVAVLVAVPFPFPSFRAATSGTFNDTFDLRLVCTYTAARYCLRGVPWLPPRRLSSPPLKPT